MSVITSEEEEDWEEDSVEGNLHLQTETWDETDGRHLFIRGDHKTGKLQEPFQFRPSVTDDADDANSEKEDVILPLEEHNVLERAETKRGGGSSRHSRRTSGVQTPRSKKSNQSVSIQAAAKRATTSNASYTAYEDEALSPFSP